MPGTTIDTALARRLHAEQLLDLPTLEACLNEVRVQRDADPDVSLALLLVERRLVPGEKLDPIVRALVDELERDAQPRGGEGRIGPYRVVRPLAAGGMGAVYEVEHTETGARYALKTIHAELAIDPEITDRFRQEAELNARLDHPHVVRIHEAHLDAQRPYLIQDLVSGGTLQDRLADGPLPLEEALTVTLQLGQALHHAHARQVIHRDLKPLNVLVDDRGEPRLTDFGLARSLRATSLRLTVTGTLLGSPNFMPPEQALGKKEVGPPADVYALGGVLYACLTGQPPFPGAAMYEVLDAVLHRPHTPIRDTRTDLERDTEQALEQLVGGMLAKEPGDRPGLDEVLDTLSRLRHGATSATWRRNNLIAMAIAGLLTLAVALSVVAYRLHTQRLAEAARAALATARGVEADLFGRWHLGLIDGADPPDAAALADAAAVLERSIRHLHDAPAGEAVLGRLRAAERLLSDEAPKPTGPATSPIDQLVDAILLARRGRSEPARLGLERVLGKIDPVARRPAWLLRVRLTADARLGDVTAELPVNCTAARALAVDRLAAMLRSEAERIARSRRADRLRVLERLSASIRAAGGDVAIARAAKRDGFDAAADAWAQAVKQPRGRAWLASCLQSEPTTPVGPNLLAAARSELERALTRFERHRNNQVLNVVQELTTAIELDHQLSYAHGSTWKTPHTLAKAVELRIVRQDAIEDPRIRTFAVGAALRAARVTQPAFRLLLARADARTVARVLRSAPRSQAFRFLKIGPRDKSVPRAQQTAWVRAIEAVLNDPGRSELAPVWLPELRFQIALAMNQIGGFAAEEREAVTRLAYASPDLPPLRIEPIASMRAAALADLKRGEEVDAWVARGVTRLRALIKTSSRLHDRLQRSLMTLERNYALTLCNLQRGEQALKVLTASEATFKGLFLRREDDRWLLDAARAHALRRLRRLDQAWAALRFAHADPRVVQAAMESSNLCAQELILLTRKREGDDAARALLRQVSAKRLSDSAVLRDLKAQLER